jgi:hypothetical protein
MRIALPTHEPGFADDAASDAATKGNLNGAPAG